MTKAERRFNMVRTVSAKRPSMLEEFDAEIREVAKSSKAKWVREGVKELRAIRRKITVGKFEEAVEMLDSLGSTFLGDTIPADLYECIDGW